MLYTSRNYRKKRAKLKTNKMKEILKKEQK